MPLFGLTFAAEIRSSVWSGIGEGAHAENGALIIGLNPGTLDVSGYYESSDITGNITAECKLYFYGRLVSSTAAEIHVVSAHPDFLHEQVKEINGKLKLERLESNPVARLYIDQVPASCNWLFQGLPSYKPPTKFSLENGFAFEFLHNGDWKSVAIIRSQRAPLYDKAAISAKSKRYLVTGDLIYVFDKNEEWYFAKYRSGRREVSGWIRRLDTVLPANQQKEN